LKLPSGAAISLPVRAKHLDGWTREFLAAHPRSTVLHLGCGLDTRVYRVDPPAGARWYDVDLPAVIELPDLVSRLGRSAFSRAYFRAVAAGFKRNSMLHLRYQFN
jgi:O-methyltransferase involved in polyketide biosynthesis